MNDSQDKIKLFETQQVRTEWDAAAEKWWFSVIDIVAALTEQPDYTKARKYWSVLKTRLKKEGSQLATNCSQLKLTAADGKKYLTDVADTEQIFRLIQSIPSKRAEPFKLWLAQVGSERLDETLDPELSIDRAIHNYRRLGYSEISQVRNPEGFAESAEVAKEGAKTAKAARLQLEKSTGKPVVSQLNAKQLAAQQLESDFDKAIT